jgi:hypothetical protein
VVLHEVTVEGVHWAGGLQHGQLEHSLLLLFEQSSWVQLEQWSLFTDPGLAVAARGFAPKAAEVDEFSYLLNSWPCATTTNPTKGQRPEAQIIVGYGVAEQTC